MQTLHYSDELPLVWSAPQQPRPQYERPVKRSQYAMVALDIFSGPPQWQLEADERLADLMMLRRGWNGPQSGPVGIGMISYIRALLQSVMKRDTPLPAFVPAHGGSVQLEWHQSGLDIELMVFRPLDAELSVHFHDGREPIEEEPLSINFDLLSKVLSEIG
ncbi:MAG: hypothetical protein V4513_04380 [Pseudomonadota bacterium]